MHLRDYQVECLKTIKEKYLAGIRRQVVCLPTGTGKTVIFAQFPAFFRMKKRMLVLAHREELLDQARNKILQANPDLQVEIEQGGRRADVHSDVVIASVQTLGRQGSRRLQDLSREQFYLLVVDEAHHAPASTYRRILDHFGVFEPDSQRLVVGFTATPKRGDGQGLDAVFQEITYSCTLPEMIDRGYLAPLAAYRVETEVDLSRVKTRMGDFVASQLSEAVNITGRNDLVVEVFRKHLASRQTLCFCVDVAHAHGLAQAFLRAGIPCAAVTGDMPPDRRRQVLADFKAARLKVLTNCLVLTEGFDEPSIAGILLARPTKSVVLYAQMIGRGTRLHPGKDNVTIIDIVDATRDHRLVQLSSLFGLPPRLDLQGRTTQEARRALQWTQAHRPWVRTDLATSLEDLRYRCRRINLFDLETPDGVGRLSSYAWTQVGESEYRLALAEGERIIVSGTILKTWDVTLEGPKSQRTLLEADRLEAAIHHADAFVKTHRQESVGLILRRSRWRTEPASDKQLQILKSKALQIPDGLTKGQASHIIGMIVRGAEGQSNGPG